MARKATKAKQGARGPRGRRGARGPQGRRGAAGLTNTGELAKLAERLDIVVHELQTQLRRIAQMQEQIDRMAAGGPSIERRLSSRTRH